MDFVLEDDLIQQAEKKRPSVENDLIRAKMFLQKHSPDSGDNMYDHLSDLLNRIISEQPENIIDFFEEYSRAIREQRFAPGDYLQDTFIPPYQYNEAKELLPFLQPASLVNEMDEPVPESEENNDKPRTDLMEHLYIMEQTGIGLPRCEMFCIALAIKKLAKNPSIASVKFWGKIFGILNNYYVAECDWTDEEYARRTEEMEAEKEAQLQAEAAAIEALEANPVDKIDVKTDETDPNSNVFPIKEKEIPGEGEPERIQRPPLPPIPISLYVPPPVTPNEMPGTGINKKVYYVCTEFGKEWIQLPETTPQAITASRNITRFLTGDLDTEFHTFPPFPGTERNYLRAIIARITAGTHVSPLNFYTTGGGFGEEEEMEGEGGGGAGGPLTENPNYQPHAVQDLIDPNLQFWVHHADHILHQGRVVWWNPNPPAGEDVGEEEDDDATGGGDEVVKPESGPALLTPLSEDASMETTPPWSARASSLCMPEFSVVQIRSNLWPGAFAYTYLKKAGTIYIGWGQKHNAHNHSPENMPMIQFEYPLGPEIMEIRDPTFAEEEAWRLAHLPKPVIPKEPEAEEGGAEEEEEEEEDDEEEEEEE